MNNPDYDVIDGMIDVTDTAEKLEYQKPEILETAPEPESMFNGLFPQASPQEEFDYLMELEENGEPTICVLEGKEAKIVKWSNDFETEFYTWRDLISDPDVREWRNQYELDYLEYTIGEIQVSKKWINRDGKVTRVKRFHFFAWRSYSEDSLTLNLEADNKETALARFAPIFESFIDKDSRRYQSKNEREE